MSPRALCDMEGIGKLSCGQFALAMWLVKRALRGIAPPAQLSRDMIPPPPQQPEAVSLTLSLQLGAKMSSMLLLDYYKTVVWLCRICAYFYVATHVDRPSMISELKKILFSQMRAFVRIGLVKIY